MSAATDTRIAEALDLLDDAARQGKLSKSAAANVRAWLTDPRYGPYAAETARHVHEGLWKELDDAFFTVIPFGTGGRRGRMYPIGCNAINDRTIGESAQGLADYVLSQRRPGDTPPSCAIAYDTRHRSRHFAELCAEVLAAAGFKICFLDGYRSTPALSVAVRHKRCSCGIMVTASHNPPSDNAVKIYGSTGGQLVPPHDAGVIDRVRRVADVRRKPFAQAVSAGQIEFCQDEIDAAYLVGILSQSVPGPRDLKILFSPMHGVGAHAVCPALIQAGFPDVEVFGPHAAPDGDFPNVPGHVANPENPQTFEALIEHALATGKDLAVSTDPDADRIGAAAPVAPGGPWATIAGNPLCALLTHFLLESRRAAGTLLPRHFVAKTLVTTGLVRRIAEDFGVRCVGDLLVGFKWIAEAIDREGAEHFVCGCEESHGFQAGTYARDKDGAVAVVLLAELASACKARGETLHQQLDRLYLRYGCHAERTVSVALPGSQGREQMQALMARLRREPPKALAGLAVARIRDYEMRTEQTPDGETRPLAGPRGDLVFLDLERPDNSVAVRPSGTEPKIKMYLFASEPPVAAGELAASKARLQKVLDDLAADIALFARGTK
ncbi:MAG: phospho-sugar mutase [Planctomycetia bacterium]|nr:phospho-sugar mutase [Planctomycetia bacterium]